MLAVELPPRTIPHPLVHSPIILKANLMILKGRGIQATHAQPSIPSAHHSETKTIHQRYTRLKHRPRNPELNQPTIHSRTMWNNQNQFAYKREIGFVAVAVRRVAMRSCVCMRWRDPAGWGVKWVVAWPWQPWRGHDHGTPLVC